MEAAPGRGRGGAGQVAGEDDPLAPVAADRGDGGDERLGVRVAGRAVQLRRRGQLDEPPQIHHPDAPAAVLDDAEVVGDEEVGEVEPFLQVVEQVDDLRPDRHVQRGDRLVADDQLRVQGQRPGDAHALLLAAGQLVGIAREVGPGQPDHVAQLRGPRAPLLRPVQAVDQIRLQQDVEDPAAGIQTGRGVLEDHLRLAAEAPQRIAPELRDVGPVEDDPALGEGPQPQEGLAQGGLAAAGLAHQAEGLAPADRQVDPVHGAQGDLPPVGLPDGEISLDALHADQDIVSHHARSSPRKHRTCRPSGRSSRVGRSVLHRSVA